MKRPAEAGPEPFDSGSGDPPRVPFRRVLLVGFMGSGKTTVGRKLAGLLGWEFVDIDDVIEERSGRTIPEIFRSGDEGRFRELEATVASEQLGREGVVLASGGGWPAARGRMETLGADTFSVWLQVSPKEAVRRVQAGGPPRPLLGVGHPVERAAELLDRRRDFYALARLVVDTEAQDPDQSARRIAEEIETWGREPGHRPG